MVNTIVKYTISREFSRAVKPQGLNGVIKTCSVPFIASRIQFLISRRFERTRVAAVVILAAFDPLMLGSSKLEAVPLPTNAALSAQFRGRKTVPG